MKKPVKNARLSMDLSEEHYEFLEELRNRCHKGGGNRLNKSAVLRAIISGAKDAGVLDCIGTDGKRSK